MAVREADPDELTDADDVAVTNRVKVYVFPGLNAFGFSANGTLSPVFTDDLMNDELSAVMTIEDTSTD